MIYRLLALDVDGTVAGNDRRVSPVVRAAVAAAQARGVHITLATGRVFRSALPFARDLGLSAPLICAQGAVIKHCVTLDVLHHVPLSGTLVAEAITMLHDVGVCISGRSTATFSARLRRWRISMWRSSFPSEG